MIAASCKTIVLLLLPMCALWAQKTSPKFDRSAANTALDHVLHETDIKTFKGNVSQVLGDQKTIVLGIEGAPRSLVAAKSATAIPREVAGLPVDVTLEKKDGDVVVSGIQPNVVSAWNRSNIVNDEVDRTVRALDDKFQSFVKATQHDRQNFNEVLKAANDTHEVVLTAFANTPLAQRDDRVRLARLNTAVSEFRKKANYGDDDNFWPEVYSRMYKNSRSVVAVALRGRSTPVATGVLVGKDLVLTAAHVFGDDEAQDFDVWFDFENTSNGALPPKAFPIKKLVFEGQPVAGLTDMSLDFALVEIGPHVAPGQQPRTCAQMNYVPLPLTSVQSFRDDKVYVIGHPKGFYRTIHDNAKILFPYLLSERRKTALDADVESKIPDYVAQVETDVSKRREKELLELDDYRGSFKKVPEGYKYVNRGLGPAIGVDTDTFPGDSGAPALLRRGAGTADGVIGVFIGGLSESVNVASWQYHEVILPIREVITQLNEQLPNWGTTYEVVILTP